jgi:hypothetical protein
MSTFKITLDKTDSPVYLPGEEVKGKVSLVEGSPEKTDKFKVNLVWQTRGKGTSDSEVVDSSEFTSGGIADGGRFSFKIPEEGPYSLAGRLLSISWQVELRGGKQKDKLAIAPITVSPTGQPVAIFEVVRQIEARGAFRPV